MFLGGALRLAAAFCLENIAWPDEIFQSLEQAHRLVFGYGIVPWEYVAGLRSYLVPLFLAAVIFPFKYLSGHGSFAYTATVRVALCLMSLSLIVFAYQYAKTFGNRLAGSIAACLVAFWYEFIFFAPKAFGDLFAVYLILPGLFFAERGLRDKRPRDLLWSGLLLALGGMVRYQNLFLLALPPALSFWYGFKAADRKLLRHYLYSALAVSVAAGVLDWLIWGRLFHSLLYSFDFYLVRGGATSSLLTPFDWYVRTGWRMQGYLFPLLCGLAWLSWPRVKLLWAALLFYFILHTGIASKEYRYIFLCWPLLMIAAALGAETLLSRISRPELRRAWLGAGAAGFIFFSVYSAGKFTWGDLGYRSSYLDGRQPAWTVLRAKIRAYRYLSGRPDIRGLSDDVYNWHWSPGYYYLHKDIPVFFNAPGPAAAGRANYFISRAPRAASGLERVKQIGDIYIYKAR
ncbi:MAG: glycosyltransferase family 39 protein [Candidatus Saganbacteria bacterium]|nr:glycosyltransferase family 39 protein [Candidatus Saganbacteria bacterium]